MNLRRKILLCTVLLICFVLVRQQTLSAARKPKLNTTKHTMTEGKTCTIVLKNYKKKIKWSSSKKKIASVNKKGKVKALKPGKVVITAKAGKRKYKCRITVTKKKPVNHTEQEANQYLEVIVPTAAPVLTNPHVYAIQPAYSYDQLSIRGQIITFGETKDSIVNKLGNPARIDETEYTSSFMVYNDDYSNFVMVAVDNDKVVGWYTDAMYFSYSGLTTGSDINMVNEVFNVNEELNKRIDIRNSKADIRILMDTIGDKTVEGIYVMSSDISKDKVSDTLVLIWEKEIFDMTNSFRVRNNVPVLQWSDPAAVSARLHCSDMASNAFFSHYGTDNSTPDERMTRQGIAHWKSGENIAYGMGYYAYNAVYSANGWINSPGHRVNILDAEFTNMGVGCVVKDSYTFTAQNFYGVR